MQRLYSLNFKAIFIIFLKTPLSFKLVLVYLFFEYLRPQMMYPVIDVIPWGMTILILLILCTILEGRIFNVNNFANFIFLIFIIVIILSGFFAISPSTSFSSWRIVAVISLTYYLITHIVDTEEKYFIFLIFFLVINLKLSQFVFRNWVISGFTYQHGGAAAGIGWLENSGELAIQMVICFVLGLYLFLSVKDSCQGAFKLIFITSFSITSFGSIFAAGSRGSYLALAGVFFLMWLSSKHKLKGTIILILIICSLPLIISQRDMERLSNMGGPQDNTAQNRLVRWEKGVDLMNKYPLFGVGFKNWEIADQRLFRGTGALSHNIFIECGSELGYSGLIVYCLLIFATYHNNLHTMNLTNNGQNKFIYFSAKALNIAMFGFLIAGFFVTVLYYLYFWVNLAMTVSLNNIAKNKYSSTES